MKAGGDRFTMSHVNLVASHTLQHGVWAASQYFNNWKTWKIGGAFSSQGKVREFCRLKKSGVINLEFSLMVL